jgi:hypothetical protein
MNKKIQVAKYVVADFISAAVAWALFFVYRKIYIEAVKFGVPAEIELDSKFYLGVVILPVFWVIAYAFSGTYSNIFRKSRLKEFGQTLYISIIGVLIIFFTLLLDDTIVTYKTYYSTFFVLLGLHFFITAIVRFTLTSITGSKIKSRKIGFNTLLVGSNQKALKLYNELNSAVESQGNLFIGFIHVDHNNGHLLKGILPHLGSVNDLRSIIETRNVEEVIIAIESSEHESIGRIINLVEDTPVIVKIIPDMYDILSGSVKMNAIFGAPLIEISPDLMPVWQQTVKRLIDIIVSLFLLIILSPVFIVVSLAIVISSRGPVFFVQERIGLHGVPFNIYKFRSMFLGAENGTPMLSSENDNRITPLVSLCVKSGLMRYHNFIMYSSAICHSWAPDPSASFLSTRLCPLPRITGTCTK